MPFSGPAVNYAVIVSCLRLNLSPASESIDHAILLDNEQVAALLQISKRTLQRLRSEKKISYYMVRGNCRYSLSEVERMVRSSIVFCDPKRLEEFKQNYMMRTGKRIPTMKKL